MGRPRSARRARYQTRIKGGAVYYTAIDIGAAAKEREEEEEEEARSLQATKAKEREEEEEALSLQEIKANEREEATKGPAGFVIHFPGDGLENGTKRAAVESLRWVRPAPPPPRLSSSGCLSSLFSSSTFPRTQPWPIPDDEPIGFQQLMRYRVERCRAMSTNLLRA